MWLGVDIVETVNHMVNQFVAMAFHKLQGMLKNIGTVLSRVKDVQHH